MGGDVVVTSQQGIVAECLELQLEEVAALEAIYGTEFVRVKDEGVQGLELTVEDATISDSITTTASGRNLVLRTVWRLPTAYPLHKIPEIIAVHLNANNTSPSRALALIPTDVAHVTEALTSILRDECAVQAKGSECLFLLLQLASSEARRLFIEAAAHDAINTESTAKSATIKATEETINDDNLGVTVLLLDHMRAKKAYCATLESWANRLGLAGGILTLAYHKHVYIVLRGSSKAVTTFCKRLRTEKVDVDSKGRPCRERQSQVLVHQAPLLRQRDVVGRIHASRQEGDCFSIYSVNERNNLRTALLRLGVPADVATEELGSGAHDNTPDLAT